MKTKPEKGTYGYLNQNKVYAWKKAALMLAVPVFIFLISWFLNKTRMNIMTVVAIVGSLPGCNQIVHAVVASRYHSVSRELYEEVEQVRKDRPVIYENVLTTYEKTYYVDCLVISGRDMVGYSSDGKTDPAAVSGYIKDMLKKNSYKQNVRVYREREAFLKQLRLLTSGEPEKVPFAEDERCPGMTRDEILMYLLKAVSL